MDRIYHLVPAFNGGDNPIWVFGLDERFGLVIVLCDEAVDGALQIGDGAEDAALKPPFGKLCEEPLHGSAEGIVSKRIDAPYPDFADLTAFGC